MPSRVSVRFFQLIWSLLALPTSSLMVFADADAPDSTQEMSTSQSSLIISQPTPYTRAQEFVLPGSNMSTLTGTPFTGAWSSPDFYNFGAGRGYLPGSAFGPVYAGNRLWGQSYRGWGNGYAGQGMGGAFPGTALTNPYTESGLGFGNWGGGLRGYGSNYGGLVSGNYRYGNGYGNYPAGNSGYGSGCGGGLAGYGAYSGMGSGAGAFGSGTQLGLTAPSHIVQTEPSKASGNYYSPSTVDTTASGSYYAQTDSAAVQMPVKHGATNSNYWKQDNGSSNYWGSGGGSSTPFGKDLNSVPWNK